MRSELLAELEELRAMCDGTPVEWHRAFLRLRQLLPEVIAAVREWPPQG